MSVSAYNLMFSQVNVALRLQSCKAVEYVYIISSLGWSSNQAYHCSYFTSSMSLYNSVRVNKYRVKVYYYIVLPYTLLTSLQVESVF